MNIARTSLLGGIVFLAVVAPASAEQPTPASGSGLVVLADIRTDGASLLAFLAKHTGDDQTLVKLDEAIRRLGSDDFDERSRAAEKITSLGFVALPILRKTAKATTDAEVSRQLNDCIGHIERNRNPFHLAAAIHELIRQKPEGTAAALFRFSPYAGDDELEADLAYALDELAQKRLGDVPF